MLTIAICDDDASCLERTCELVRSYLKDHPLLSGILSPFSRGRDLLAQVERQSGFDLYLLDVLMPEVNGIETGRRLRGLGDGGEIIYLSSSDEYGVESYDVRAFHYLLKPLEQDRLFGVLDDAIEKLDRRRSDVLMVHTPNGARRVMFESVRYVERVGRRMRYHCTDGTFDSQSIRTPFREALSPLLSDPCFRLCGASFVVSCQHVTGVSGRTALLDDGTSLDLPQASAAEFKRAWGRYWLGDDA